MVVGPEFGPLAALAVALVRRKTYLARRAALALLVGFPVAMLITAVGVLAGEALGWIEVTSTRELTDVDFIFQVGPLSFVVALFAGAAGMLSLVSASVGRPCRRLHLGDDGARSRLRRCRGDGGDWDIAAKSATQPVVNLAGIVLAAIAVLWVRRLADRRDWHMLS